MKKAIYKIRLKIHLKTKGRVKWHPQSVESPTWSATFPTQTVYNKLLKTPVAELSQFQGETH